MAIKKIRPTDDVLQLRCCLRELAILQHFGVHEHPNLLGLRSVLRPPEGALARWRDVELLSKEGLPCLEWLCLLWAGATSTW